MRVEKRLFGDVADPPLVLGRIRRPDRCRQASTGRRLAPAGRPPG
jgi:hypothetical protein